MRTAIVTGLVVVAASAAVIAGWLVNDGTAAVPASEATRVMSGTPMEPDEPAGPASGADAAPGVPAIDAQAGVVPGFSTEDVEAYVRDTPHRHQRAGARSPTVVSVEFIRAGELAARMATDFHRADDAILAVATLKGDFHVAGPVGITGYSGETSRLVFDGVTGNLLLVTVE